MRNTQDDPAAANIGKALLLPSFLGATAFTTLIILGTEKYGMNRHIWDVHSSTFEYTALIGWAAELAFITSTCCTKVSVLLFFRRLTEGTFNRIWKVVSINSGLLGLH